MKKISFQKTIISISSNHSIKALDALIKWDIQCQSIKRKKDGSLDIIIMSSHKEEIEHLFATTGISNASFSTYRGINYLLSKYSKRFGIYIGIFIMLVTSYISSKTVWNISIEGNLTVSDEEIIDSLKENGFGIGTYIPSVDFNSLHNRILLNSDNLAWISVNMDGNTANIQIREISKEDEKAPFYYANVVAKEDGQIALIKKYNGIKTVNILDTVKKGDILISGVLDSKSQGVRYIQADGEVEAYVKKKISVKIPIDQTVKRYTGRTICDKSVEIFSKNINILKNSRNLYNNYDTIETSENLTLFGKLRLPVKIKKTVYSEYEYTDVSYTTDEVRDMAMAELRYKMDEALKDSELISKKVSHSKDNLSYYIDCELYCYENIAEIVKFKVEER